MKLQFNILIAQLKKNWLWILIFILLTILGIIFYYIRPTGIEFKEEDFLMFIAYPSNMNYGTIPLLLLIYQIGLTIYLIYTLYTFELYNSFENVMLRIKQKKWIVNKLITNFLFIIIFKVSQIFIIYILFLKQLSFKYIYLVSPIIYNVILLLLIMTSVNFIKKQNFIFYFIPLIIGFLIFVKFNIWLCLIFIIILLILNIKHFNFKRYYLN